MFLKRCRLRIWCLEVPSPRNWNQLPELPGNDDTAGDTSGHSGGVRSRDVMFMGCKPPRIKDYDENHEIFFCLYFWMCYQWFAIVLLSCCGTDIFHRTMIADRCFLSFFSGTPVNHYHLTWG